MCIRACLFVLHVLLVLLFGHKPNKKKEITNRQMKDAECTFGIKILLSTLLPLEICKTKKCNPPFSRASSYGIRHPICHNCDGQEPRRTHHWSLRTGILEPAALFMEVVVGSGGLSHLLHDHVWLHILLSPSIYCNVSTL